WAVVPLVSFFMFLGAPFPGLVPKKQRQTIRHLFLKPYYLFALGAIFFGGGSEIVMNQWASAFMERGLMLPKVTGDILGMCGFAAMIGVGRLLHGLFGKKLNLNNLLIGSSAMAVICYLTVALAQINALNIAGCIVCGLAVSLLWPGTLTISARRFPLAGAWLFAILAGFGDIGGSAGSWLTGMVMDKATGLPIIQTFSSVLGVSNEQGALRFGILVASIFPFASFIFQIILRNKNKSNLDEIR
ncbi:MAG: hypothetical protein WCP73_09715, partial [Eubacteriales bacterium]